MSDSTRLVQDHYAHDGLTERIFAALRTAGANVNALTRDDLAPFEEFHLRGRDATRDVARLAQLQRDMHVLDIGCGIGGPARTLAAEFGCRVTGLDLVPQFVEAATELTRRVGLADRARFQQGDALRLPFPDAGFDAVLFEHVNMNVHDKPRLYREAARVLRPGGTLALYEICGGPSAPAHFPVPWASQPQISFLVSPDELLAAARGAGLRELERRDVTQQSLDWIRGVIASMPAPDAGAPPPPLGLQLVMGPDAPRKATNVLRNLEEDRIRVVQAVLSRA